LKISSIEEISNHLSECEAGQEVSFAMIKLNNLYEVFLSIGPDLKDSFLESYSDKIQLGRANMSVFRVSNRKLLVIFKGARRSNSLELFAEKCLTTSSSLLKINGEDISINTYISIIKTAELTSVDQSYIIDLFHKLEITLESINSNQKYLENLNKTFSKKIKFYEKEILIESKAQAELESLFKGAVKAGHIRPFYQAQVNSLTGEVIGLETLARWYPSGNTDNVIEPSGFLELVEEKGLIELLDRTILVGVLHDIREWKGSIPLPSSISLNITPEELYNPNFLKNTLGLLEAYNIEPSLIKFELTENQLIINEDQAIHNIKEMKKAGFGFVLDDFGTGFSSLLYLKKLPIDGIKIDRSFIKDLVTSSFDQSIVKTLIEFSKGLNIDIIAEGVEDEETLNMLRDLGLYNIQGFVYNRPSRPEDIIVNSFS